MASTGGVKLGSTYDEARTRKVTAEAEIAELELAKIQGTLVSADDVVKAWEDVLGALKAKLLSVPTKGAPVISTETDTPVCQRILEDLINEALEELSNYDPKVSAASSKTPSGPNDVKKPTRARRGRPKKTETI